MAEATPSSYLKTIYGSGYGTPPTPPQSAPLVVSSSSTVSAPSTPSQPSTPSTPKITAGDIAFAQAHNLPSPITQPTEYKAEVTKMAEQAAAAPKQISATAPQNLMAGPSTTPTMTGQEAMTLVNPAYGAGIPPATSGMTGPATLRFLTPSEIYAAGLPLVGGAPGTQSKPVEYFARVYPSGKFDILNTYGAFSAESGRPVIYSGSYVPPQPSAAAIPSDQGATMTVNFPIQGGGTYPVRLIVEPSQLKMVNGELQLTESAKTLLMARAQEVFSTTGLKQATVSQIIPTPNKSPLYSSGGEFITGKQGTYLGVPVKYIENTETGVQTILELQPRTPAQAAIAVNIAAVSGSLSPEALGNRNIQNLIAGSGKIGTLEAPSMFQIQLPENAPEAKLMLAEKEYAKTEYPKTVLGKMGLPYVPVEERMRFVESTTGVFNTFIQMGSRPIIGAIASAQTEKFPNLGMINPYTATELKKASLMTAEAVPLFTQLVASDIPKAVTTFGVYGAPISDEFLFRNVPLTPLEKIERTEAIKIQAKTPTFEQAPIGTIAGFVLQAEVIGGVLGASQATATKATEALKSSVSELSMKDITIARTPLGGGRYRVLSVQVGPAATSEGAKGAVTSVTETIVNEKNIPITESRIIGGQFREFSTGQVTRLPAQEAISKTFDLKPYIDYQMAQEENLVREYVSASTKPMALTAPTRPSFQMEFTQDFIKDYLVRDYSVPFTFGGPTSVTNLAINLNPSVTTVGRTVIPSTKAAGIFETMQVQESPASIGGAMKIMKMGQIFEQPGTAMREIPWWPSYTTRYTITAMRPSSIGAGAELGGSFRGSVGQALSQAFTQSVQQASIITPQLSISDVSIVGGAIVSTSRVAKELSKTQEKAALKEISIQEPIQVQPQIQAIVQRPVQVQETIQKPIQVQVPIEKAIQKPIQVKPAVEEPIQIQQTVEKAIQLPVQIQPSIQTPETIQIPITGQTITTIPIIPTIGTPFGGPIPKGNIRDIPLSGLPPKEARIRKRRIRVPTLERFVRPDLISEWISYNRFGRATSPRVTSELLRQIEAHPLGYVPTREMQLGKGGAESQRLPRYANLFKGFKLRNPFNRKR